MPRISIGLSNTHHAPANGTDQRVPPRIFIRLDSLFRQAMDSLFSQALVEYHSYYGLDIVQCPQTESRIHG